MENDELLPLITEGLLADSSSSDEELFNDVLSRRRHRIYKPRIDQFSLHENEDEFRLRFRMSPQLVQSLVDKLDPELRHYTRRSQALTTAQQVLLTLHFYASGTFQRCIGDMSGVHRSTISRVVHHVSCVIARMRPQHICMPTNPSEIEKIVEDFFEISSFPKILGSIDCTHIPIQSPGGDDAEYYRNRKDSFSINVQAVVDSNLVIRNIVARWPGSAHDSHIFNSSSIKGRLQCREFGDTWLLGDKGYALQPYLLTPLADPGTEAERLYNEAHARTRNVVERTFGVWKRRFPILATKLRCKIERVQPIIVATAVLHNICRMANDVDPPDFLVDSIEEVDTNYAPQQQPSSYNESNRISLINNYFTGL